MRAITEGRLRAEARLVAVDGVIAAMASARAAFGEDAPPPDLRPSVRVSFDIRRRSSRGGRYPSGYGVSLALAGCFPSAPAPLGAAHLFREYRAIATDRVIGSFFGDWRDHIRATAAHEAAHVVQHWMILDRPHVAKAWAHRGFDPRKPHGRGWRRIYAAMRRGAGLIAEDRATRRAA